jgi:hypothetical protein
VRSGSGLEKSHVTKLPGIPEIAVWMEVGVGESFIKNISVNMAYNLNYDT